MKEIEADWPRRPHLRQRLAAHVKADLLILDDLVLREFTRYRDRPMTPTN